MAKNNEIPGPRGWETLKVLKGLLYDTWNQHKQLKEKYGDTVAIHFPQEMVFFYHPDAVQHILKTNAKCYVKGNLYKPLRALLGNGLVTADGEDWKKSRRVVGNEFSSKALKKFSFLMTEEVTSMAESWREQCHSGPKELDISKEMMSLTFNIIGRTLFGAQLGKNAETIQHNLGNATDIMFRRATTGWSPPSFLPFPSNLTLNGIVGKFNDIVYGIIKNEKKEKADDINVLSKLLKAKDEQGKNSLTEQQVRDEVMTLMLAGHETTSNLLTWTFYLLSKNPRVEEKLLLELNKIEGDYLTHDHYSKDSYLNAVINESMRLYPPVPIVGRMNIEEDTVGGYTISPNTVVECLQLITHYDGRFFKDPETFNPERFMGNDEVYPGSFFPFALGPRHCIGAEFSLLESQILLGSLVKNFHIVLKEGFVPKPVPSISLQAKTGLFMKIEKRSP